METINNAAPETIAEGVTEVIGLLDARAKLPEVIETLNLVIARLNEAGKPRSWRDRGPESTREMTEDDARRVLLGDLKDKSHKDAATELGLSYGQVYSARKGFTFKYVYKEFREAAAAQ